MVVGSKAEGMVVDMVLGNMPVERKAVGMGCIVGHMDRSNDLSCSLQEQGPQLP